MSLPFSWDSTSSEEGGPGRPIVGTERPREGAVAPLVTIVTTNAATRATVIQVTMRLIDRVRRSVRAVRLPILGSRFSLRGMETAAMSMRIRRELVR